MIRWLGFSVFGIMAGPLVAADLTPPIDPDEAKVITNILSIEKHPIEVAETPAFAKTAIVKRLQEYGVDTTGLQSWAVRNKEKAAQTFHCYYDKTGRVLALTGNGPWLRDDSIRELRKLPELRIIRCDHNGFVKSHPQAALYSGTGFEALANSKIVEIKLTLGLNDAGLEQIARIQGLKSLTIVHSQVTEAGVKFLEGHPGLQAFTIAEMGRVSQKALAAIAKMPQVTHVGFQEAFITYDDGFKHLLGMKDRLQELNLTMSVVNEADLQKLRADLPHVKVITIPPEDIPKRHMGVANNLAKIATGEAGQRLKKAIAEQKLNKP